MTTRPPATPGHGPSVPWTRRQREVLALLVEGATNSQIAEKLGISRDGAKWHVSEILTKLGVARREEAADYWRRENGLGPRLRRLARALVPAGVPLRWAAFGAVGAVAVTTTVAVVLVLASPGGGPPAAAIQPTVLPAPSGAPVESSTPTLPPPTDSSLETVLERLVEAGVGAVVDAALAQDVGGLLDLVAFAPQACDDSRTFGVYGDDVTEREGVCAHHGVEPGTDIPMIYLPGADQYVDRETLQAAVETVFATEPTLVFAAATSDGIGMSFASTPRERLGFGLFAGMWFTVSPAEAGPAITAVFFHGPYSGPRLLYQHFYQDGGEVWYHDEEHAPGPAPTPPDTPPTERP